MAEERFEFRSLDPASRLAVCSCGHRDDHDPLQVESRRRYLESEAARGLRVIVAHLAGEPVGFVQLVPVETAARDVRGTAALFLHCVTVFRPGLGAGRSLVEEAVRLAAAGGRGLVVDACRDVYGFMPEQFFHRLGFRVAQARGSRRLMHLGLPPSVPPPAYQEPRYAFRPVRGKVGVDVFFTPLCGGLQSVEVQIMRQAARSYPGRVLVKAFNCGDQVVRERYGIARAVFVDGVMRPNGDVINLEEARRLLERALARPAPGRAQWDDSISRLF